MEPDEADGRSVALEREECLRLLAAGSFGRLAVALGDGPPVIRPVNYAFDRSSQSVVFRTGEGSKLHALLQSARDAVFEVDDHDSERRSGWSVIIVGVPQEVTAAGDIARLERIGLRPYDPVGKEHWVQIRARTVTGRRVSES